MTIFLVAAPLLVIAAAFTKPPARYALLLVGITSLLVWLVTH